MNFKSKRFWIPVGIVLFVCIVILSGESKPINDTATTNIDNEVLSFIAWKANRDNFGQICSSGVIKNISNENLNFVKVIFTYNDRLNNFVSTDSVYATTESLAPGSTTTFKGCKESQTSDVSIVFENSKIGFIGEIGNNNATSTLLAKDDRPSKSSSSNTKHKTNPASAKNTLPTNVSETPALPLNFSSYSRMQIDQYTKNPSSYKGSSLELVAGVVSDFLAKNDRGGNSNYIQVENAMSPSLDKLMVEVSDNSDYQNIISSINKGDFINVFGVGKASSSFTLQNGGTTLVPTISAQRIEKCQPYDCKEANTTVIFSK